MKTQSIKEFYKSLSKISKAIIVLSVPLLLSLFLGCAFIQLYIILKGSTETNLILLNDLIKCSGDSLLSIIIPLFFIEIYSRFS